ncbi:MAG: fumarylacetoacetate hydrolase family protein [Pseudomonadota bacterium]
MWARFVGGSVVVFAALVGLAWLTSPDPRFNPASFEDEPLVMGIAPLTEAITLAQTMVDGETATIAVLGFDGEMVAGIDLADLGAERLDDPFAVLASLGPERLVGLDATTTDRVAVPVADLLPTGPAGDRHLAMGTNFPEHAAEADSDMVFNFPKFGTATPARTTVSAPAGGLLDYEVELCMRFDRAITSVADFDAAVKGLFLCADFTNRIKLLELVDPDNNDAGFGFSDAKSGPGFFPTGPFLVIPNDWASFVANQRITTDVNGEPRQDARGGEMILDYQELAEKTLNDMDRPRFLYQDEFYKLAPNGQIDADMTLMSGTGEGVIFTMPSRKDYIEMVLAYVLAGGPLSDRSLRDIAVPVFVENEIEGGHYLQPGDVVTYRSSTLGDIVVDVTD